MEFVVTCMPGLAPWLRDELKTLGLDAEESGAAAVRLDATLEGALRTCLWSRLAERVLLPIARHTGTPDDAAEALAARFVTEEHLPADGSLHVHAEHAPGLRGDPRITGTVFCRHLDRRVTLQKDAAGALCLWLQINESESTLFVDLSGVALSRRGYRLQGGAAPLRETLAAALLRAAGWPGESTTLVDPFCGSGTVLIEAALMACNLAPGLLREDFGFLHWRGCRRALWQRLCDEARAAVREAPPVRLKGFDADPRALHAAEANAERAGVATLIHFERRDFGLLAERDFAGEGIVVTNPPWGERLEDRDRAAALHQGLGQRLASIARGWPLVVLGSEVEVLDRVGGELLDQWKVRNGPLNNYIRRVRPLLRAPAPALRAAGESAFELPPQAQPLANRLRRNARQLRRWLEAEGIQAYRLYDRDLPEFNVSVDIYGDRVLVHEFAPPKSIDPQAAEQRRLWAVSAVRAVLGAHREQVFLRTRAPQKGNTQYRRLADRNTRHVVQEGPVRLLVNLTAYLDCGLFLDHRPIRLRLGQECAGKRFLNLFGYTGSATVHAAVGGARSSVTVDASARYLDWAAENLALNGISTVNHRLERGDVMAWLLACRDQFDVVFCDPPTFSNSKSRDDFVVQRDHGELVRRIMKRLEPGGVLYFSNNFSRFRLNDDLRRQFEVEDLTRWSIPPDFPRQAPHQLFAIRHAPGASAVADTPRAAAGRRGDGKGGGRADRPARAAGTTGPARDDPWQRGRARFGDGDAPPSSGKDSRRAGERKERGQGTAPDRHRDHAGKAAASSSGKDPWRAGERKERGQGTASGRDGARRKRGFERRDPGKRGREE